MWATGKKTKKKNTGHVLARGRLEQKLEKAFAEDSLWPKCVQYLVSPSPNESWCSTRFPQFYISLSLKNFSSDLPITDFAQELIQACFQAVQQWKRFPLKQRQSALATIQHSAQVSQYIKNLYHMENKKWYPVWTDIPPSTMSFYFTDPSTDRPTSRLINMM